jgi:stage II sporulation protein D
MKKYLVVFSIVIVLYILSLFSICFGQEMIRVAIMKGQESIKISGGEISIIDCLTGETIASGSNGSVVIIDENENSLKINQISYPFSDLVITNTSGILRVNNKGYRGKVEVVKKTGESLLVINELNLEDYLVGLINQEVSSSWDMEALKAQAVAARTYALFQKSNRKDSLYHLDSTVLDQVYNGSDSEDQRSLQAVKETEGEVIVYQNEIISAVYHSCCGGKTEPARLVFQNGSSLIQSVTCGFCNDFPRYFWELKLSHEEIKKRLNADGYQIEKVKKIKVEKRSETNRVIELSIKGKGGNVTIPGNDLRRIIGFDRLRSTNFIVKNFHGSTQFLGIGYGHGVGLCQWGAKKMAESGYPYRKILQYYYPFAEIKKVY